MRTQIFMILEVQNKGLGLSESGNFGTKDFWNMRI